LFAQKPLSFGVQNVGEIDPWQTVNLKARVGLGMVYMAKTNRTPGGDFNQLCLIPIEIIESTLREPG
jgi:hypothetical protein